MSIPRFGLGTYRLQGQTVIDSVTNALSLGYRAIDTAQIYDNEADVGQAIADSGVPREQLFVTTKIWVNQFRRDRLIPSLNCSLDKLRMGYVDLALIHWPSPKNEVAMSEYLPALAEAQAQGLTRQIGVSNFNSALLKQAIDLVGASALATNQVEISPYLQNRKLADYARGQGIHLTSYMTLAVGRVLKDPVLKDIAHKHEATPAQVALAWAMQLGYSVIPSSTRRENLASNLGAQNLQLTPDDLQRIATLDRGQRQANPASLAPDWD